MNLVHFKIEFEKSDFARFVSTKSLSVIVESINFVFCKSSPLKEHKFIKQFLKDRFREKLLTKEKSTQTNFVFSK